MNKFIRFFCLITCVIAVASADNAPTVKDLIHDLKSGDIDKKEHAAEALGEMGPAAEPAIGALYASLNDELPYVRIHCVQALVKIGSPALPALIKAMKNPNADVRMTATTAMGDLGADNQAAVTALTEALHDRELQVRGAAALSLGKLGTSAQSAIPALQEATKDSDATVAADATQALSRVNAVTIGKHEEPAPVVPVVTPPPPPKTAPHPAPQKKKPVAVHPKVVKKIKAPPPPRVLKPEELMQQLEAGGIPISTGTELALIQRSTETTPLLIQALQGASTTTAELSAGVLEKIASEDAKKAVAAYRKRLQDKNMIGLIRDLRQEGKTSEDAATTLVHIGGPAVIPVSQVLSDPKETSRRAAARVLNQLGAVSAPVTATLITALDDKDSEVRNQCAEALKKINSPEAYKALRFYPIKDKWLRLLSYF